MVRTRRRTQRFRLSTAGFVAPLALVSLMASIEAAGQELVVSQREPTRPDLRPAENLFRRGQELLSARRYEAAESLLERSVSLDPENLEARMAHVTALRRLGRHDEARGRLAETMEQFPRSLEPVVSMGYLDRALGRLDESVRWFHRGAEMEDGWYNFIRLAVSYTDLGDLDRMAEAAAGLSASPYGQALGQTLEHLYRREFAAGLEVVEVQLEHSDDEMWRSFAAALAVLVRDDARALHHYRLLAPALLEENPVISASNATEALWLAFVLDRSGESERAADLTRAALAVLEPSSPGYELPLRKVYRSAAQLMLGDSDAALAEFRSAIDDGYRSILFERIVRLEEFEMFAPLHDDPEFLEMMAEIKADNARMLERVRSVLDAGAVELYPDSPALARSGLYPLSTSPIVSTNSPAM